MSFISIPRPEGFRLAAATEFYAGFTPGSGMAAAGTDGGLTLAFRLDGSFDAVAAHVSERDGALVIELAGARGRCRACRRAR
jgi:hypothetical protein